jgi:hypothetical protein
MTTRRLPAIAASLLMLVVCRAPAPVVAQTGTVVKDAEGKPVVWDDWLERQGTSAVLLFASWAPDARRTTRALVQLERASGERGLAFVVVDVQETFEAARAALGAAGVHWFHDRHGALLKRYRVIEVPSVVVLEPDGRVAGRAEATAEAIAAWQDEASED